MVRTQIQLTEEQYRRLRRWAKEIGVSLSEAVRRCVADRLTREDGAPSRDERVRAALAVCGKFRDPKNASRVAPEHDRYLDEAYRR
ncbi:MAG: CopG family transcriptional regulator [Candidatus Rokuibacteriota bacterium]